MVGGKTAKALVGALLALSWPISSARGAHTAPGTSTATGPNQSSTIVVQTTAATATTTVANSGTVTRGLTGTAVTTVQTTAASATTTGNVTPAESLPPIESFAYADDLEKCDPTKRIALMFLVRPKGKLAMLPLWERWIEDAERWAETHGCSGKGAPLDMHFHVVGYGPETIVDESNATALGFPKGSKFVEPVPQTECGWGNLLPCQARLLIGSVEQNPDAAHYILLSEDSMPLLPFPAIYSHLVEYNRSRFKISSEAFSDWLFPNDDRLSLCPKHHQWTSLRHDHAHALAAVQHVWAKERNWAYRHYVNKVGQIAGWKAASDEWAPGCTLRWLLGPDRFNAEVERGYVTHVCWAGCGAIGTCLDHRLPCKYEHINQVYLEGLMETQSAWFLRKIDPRTKIIENHSFFEEQIDMIIDEDLEEFQKNVKSRGVKAPTVPANKLPYIGLSHGVKYTTIDGHAPPRADAHEESTGEVLDPTVGSNAERLATETTGALTIPIPRTTTLATTTTTPPTTTVPTYTIPTVTSGTAPTTGSGTVPMTGSGTAPTTGSGTVPMTGFGTAATTGSGTVPMTGSGTAATTGSGAAPTTGSGTARMTGSGPMTVTVPAALASTAVH